MVEEIGPYEIVLNILESHRRRLDQHRCSKEEHDYKGYHIAIVECQLPEEEYDILLSINGNNFTIWKKDQNTYICQMLPYSYFSSPLLIAKLLIDHASLISNIYTESGS